MIATTGGPSRRPAPRNQAVETLRIVSAFGIVGFHAQAPGAEVYYAGLVFFTLFSPLAEVLFRWDRDRSPASLAKTLLVPWLFWMAIYACVNVALGRPAIPPGQLFWALLMGTAGHLWFLPFLFLVLVLLGRAKRLGTPAMLFWISVLAATALLATASLWRPLSAELPLPIPQWAQAIPAVFAGIAIGLAPRIGKPALAGLAVMTVGGIAALATAPGGVGLPYAIALPITAAAVFLGNRPALSWLKVQPVADCMFGVYLVHLITLPIGSRLFGFHSLGAVVTAFAMALAITWVARRFVPASRLVLG